MNEEKCFCHLTDKEGNTFIVKDKEAREAINSHEILLQGLINAGGEGNTVQIMFLTEKQPEVTVGNSIVLLMTYSTNALSTYNGTAFGSSTSYVVIQPNSEYFAGPLQFAHSEGKFKMTSTGPSKYTALICVMNGVSNNSGGSVEFEGLTELLDRLNALEEKSHDPHDPVDLSSLEAEINFLVTSNTILNTSIATLQSQISVLNDEILLLKANANTGGNTGDTPSDPTLISFTITRFVDGSVIGSTELTVPQGTTWAEWVESTDYKEPYQNTSPYLKDYEGDLYVWFDGVKMQKEGGTLIKATEIIEANTTYQIRSNDGK